MLCSRCGVSGEAQLDKARRNRVIDIPNGWMGVTTCDSGLIHNYLLCGSCAEVIKLDLAPWVTPMKGVSA